MSKHASPRTTREPDRVNVHEDPEVCYWAERFGCTKKQLLAAVKRVGSQVEAVRAELGCNVPLELPSSRRTRR
jgi:hypothetical protein